MNSPRIGKVVAGADADAFAPGASSEIITSSEAWVHTLMHLAALVGVPCALERARAAVLRALVEESDPMARLASAAGAVGLSVIPARMTVADAIWTADAHSPLIAWSPVESRWLVVRKRGFFRARISTADEPLDEKPFTRLALARRLGLDETLRIAEFGIVHARELVPAPEKPVRHHGRRSTDHHGPSPVRRYLDVIRLERPDILAIISFSLVTGLLDLALPLAVSSFVSNLAFGNQSAPFIQALLFLGIALFAALALAAVIRGMQIYVSEVIQRRLFIRLAADLAYRLPRVSNAAFDGIDGPELVNRFLDIVTVQKATEYILLQGVPVVLGIVIGTAVLGFYHPTLLGFSILLWFGVGVTLLFGRGAVGACIDESRLKYEMVGWFEELARSPTLFKGPGGIAFAQQRSDQIALQFLSARKRFFGIKLRQIGALLTLEISAVSSLLLVGGWLVLQQQLTLGQLVASELIVATIVYSLSKMEGIFDSWYSGLAAIDKIGHVVDLETERDDGETASPATPGMRVQCRDLEFSYVPGRPVLSGVNLDLEPGECVALWGSIGRGSTTMLNLLFGTANPESGFIRIDGLDVRSWNLERLRERVALIREDGLVAGSISDNVRLGRNDIGVDEITAALDRVGVLNDILELPDGLDTRLVSNGLPLTSRQRLRLLFARALVLKPRMLLLDDLLDGIEVEVVRELFAALAGSGLGWTVLVATRDPSVAEQCQRYIDLDQSNA